MGSPKRRQAIVERGLGGSGVPRCHPMTLADLLGEVALDTHLLDLV